MSTPRDAHAIVRNDRRSERANRERATHANLDRRRPHPGAEVNARPLARASEGRPR